CVKESDHYDERTVSVVDTPGVCDKAITEDRLKREIEESINLFYPGPHIFLLVIRLDARFTEEEKKAVKWFEDNFGEEFSNYTLVLFTRGDALKGKSIWEYLGEDPDLKELISVYKERYTVFDNTCMGNRTQVADLFEKIDKIVHLNGNHYTRSMYEEAQAKKNSKERWSKCAGYLNTVCTQLISAGLATAVPVAGAFIAKKAAVGSMKTPVILAGAGGITKVIEWWMKPKTDS
ncbi:GTPase IMAP family member 4-like, partial [Cyclopterus lumpus]|uniref:GTPase IMAP family member 4-like n=1 Tax=Cyclopterus lumpus TaxID=8103 RepID=UPI001486E539